MHNVLWERCASLLQHSSCLGQGIYNPLPWEHDVCSSLAQHSMWDDPCFSMVFNHCSACRRLWLTALNRWLSAE